MCNLEIEKITGHEILDSRGNPTIAAKVYLKDGTIGYGAVPSGASTGIYEALELRDKDSARYLGKGVLTAVNHINTTINNTLLGMNASAQAEIDQAMILADHTSDKSNLGANAILAVSIATARAAATSLSLPLYRYLGGLQGNTLPVPMMNILNGGAHVQAKNSQDFQEFMIVPAGADCFREALRMGTEIYHSLKSLLLSHGLSTAIGDEGGFAPAIEQVEQVMDLLSEATEKAGYCCGKDIFFALDVAASEWKPASQNDMMQAEHKITGQFCYQLPKSGKEYCTDELISFYQDLIQKYPIISIEDPLDEEDWNGWKKITKLIGNQVQLVGDDLFVTNTKRLAQGISQGCGNSILIKPNQIGSLTETINAMKMAHLANYTSIASHRSGETEDTTIADLAVAMNCGQIKTGAPCRSERVAKYNRLLQIEEELGKKGIYAGLHAFHSTIATDKKLL